MCLIHIRSIFSLLQFLKIFFPILLIMGFPQTYLLCLWNVLSDWLHKKWGQRMKSIVDALKIVIELLSLLHFSPLSCSVEAFCIAKRDFYSKCFPRFSLTHYSKINPVNSVELAFKHAQDSIIILKACICTWAWLITCCLPEHPGIVDI